MTGEGDTREGPQEGATAGNIGLRGHTRGRILEWRSMWSVGGKT